MLVFFEVLVRVFHLYDDRPIRYTDEKGILKWIPGQTGYSVHGNRRQNFAEYHINNSGFNSFREFEPSADKLELAIIGDSFIEGFHQDYTNSLGKKIENQLQGVEVYEYGHSSNDFADAMHLIESYKQDFGKIDKIVIYLDYEGDLDRAEYKYVERKLTLPFLNYSKLYVYAKMIGLFDPVKNMAKNLITLKFLKKDTKKEDHLERPDTFPIRAGNFESVIEKYGFDRKKMIFLLNSDQTDERFVSYLKSQNYDYMDYANVFKESREPTTLIYDQHWNNNGRELLAKLISERLALEGFAVKK